ncbi:MAG: amidohydrolase family protein [Burkholderiaceae bacterium]
MTRPCLLPLLHRTPLQFQAPSGACDSHAHVFGPFARHPLAEDRSYTPAEFDGAAFIAHLDQLGLTRGVLVTGSASGTDNGSVLEALKLYPDRLRGVAVATDAVTDAELDRWHAAGVRGVRANLYQLDGHAVYRNGVGLEVLEALAPRLTARGWHAQIWVHAPDLPTLSPRLRQLGVPLVIDHMGRMATPRGVQDPGFQHLCALLADGIAWTKISGADRNTSMGTPYSDVDPFAAALLAANPQQVVWGTDWPHINYFDAVRVPDDGDLMNLLARWLPDPAQRQQVLVDNPARLYDFS